MNICGDLNCSISDLVLSYEVCATPAESLVVANRSHSPLLSVQHATPNAPGATLSPVKTMTTSVCQSLPLSNSSWLCCVVCDDCDALHHGDCPIHGPLKPLDSAGQDQASLAHTPLPVPAPLTVKPSSIPGAGLGVFTNQFIPKRVRVGPYEGRRVDKLGLEDLKDNAYAWEVSARTTLLVCSKFSPFKEGFLNSQIRHEDEVEGAIDASDPTHSNWLRFVNSARSEDEQNMMAFQYQGEIYYRTFKDIYPGTELLVWYGDQYANDLGISTLREGESSFPVCHLLGSGE